jgi:hypothetical protein
MAKRRARRIGTTAVPWAVISFPLLLLGWCSYENNRLDVGLEYIHPGMGLPDVITIMGTPSWNGTCFDPRYNIYGQPMAGCATELGYYGALRGLPDGHYYLVWLNSDEKVIDTAKISSP